MEIATLPLEILKSVTEFVRPLIQMFEPLVSMLKPPKPVGGLGCSALSGARTRCCTFSASLEDLVLE